MAKNANHRCWSICTQWNRRPQLLLRCSSVSWNWLSVSVHAGEDVAFGHAALSDIRIHVATSSCVSAHVGDQSETAVYVRSHCCATSHAAACRLLCLIHHAVDSLLVHGLDTVQFSCSTMLVLCAFSYTRCMPARCLRCWLLFLHVYCTVALLPYCSSPSPVLGPAEICFDPHSDDPIPVSELQGSVCVNVVRDANDSNVFQYRAVSIGNLDAGRTALGRCTMCMQQ